jgi:hypothetical protein
MEKAQSVSADIVEGIAWGFLVAAIASATLFFLLI